MGIVQGILAVVDDKRDFNSSYTNINKLSSICSGHEEVFMLFYASKALSLR